MAAPAALLAGPLVRLVLIVAFIGVIVVFADFGGFADSIIYEIEQFIQSVINPF